MNTIIQELNDFIELAKKNRRYPENTASGLKAAISRLEEVLTEDEYKSFDLLEDRFDLIMQSFFNKHKNVMTDGSLRTYQARITKVLKDYKQWGNNPQNWGSWVVKSRNRKTNTVDVSVKQTTTRMIKSDDNSPGKIGEFQNKNLYASTKFEIPLRNDVSAFISTPVDLKKSEAEKIKKYIEYLSSIAQDD